MPPEVPFYVPLLGAILAIWIGKQVFGGLGYNPFNPAVVARVGLLIALPGIMTFSPVPRGMDQNYPNVKEFRNPVDAVTCATPLSIVSASPKIKGNDYYAQANFEKVDNTELIKQYFLGCKGGAIGEVCIPAIILGALVLIGFNLINWRIPVCYVGTVAIITGAVNYFCPGVTPSPLFHLVTGGLMFAAVFMATDMVTSPITGTGCVIFAFGCGVLTSVIRIWGNYPEGVSFAILFMNALVPLIDKWSRTLPFGHRYRNEAVK
jgi:electron transport complex protein RnfD